VRSTGALLLLLCACSTPAPAPVPVSQIETVAGNGVASFQGDGRPATESPLYAPVKVGFSNQGRPWIIDWNNHRVRELVDGTLLTVVGTGVEEISTTMNVLSIAYPIHHAFDLDSGLDGDIVFAGYHDPRIFKVNARGYVRNVAGFGTIGNSGDEHAAYQAAMNTPSGIAIAPDGTVYFSEQGNAQIRRVSGDVVHRVAGTGEPGYSGDGGPAVMARLAGPTRLELDAEGRLYFCDSRNNVIRRIGTDGVIETIAGSGERGYSGDGGPALEARFALPMDLERLDDGTLLVADTENHVIRRIGPDGIITTLVGTATRGFGGDGGPASLARLDGPMGVSVDADGALWIADTGNHRVRVVR